MRIVCHKPEISLEVGALSDDLSDEFLVDRLTLSVVSDVASQPIISMVDGECSGELSAPPVIHCLALMKEKLLSLESSLIRCLRKLIRQL